MNRSALLALAASAALAVAGTAAVVSGAPPRPDDPAEAPSLQLPLPSARPPTAPSRASFSVAFGEHVVPYRVFLLTARPGEEVEIEARPGDGEPGRPPPAALPSGDRYVLRASAGTSVRTAPGSWSWSAPDRPGAYRVVVRRVPGGEAGEGRRGSSGAAAADSVVLNAVVLVPFSRLRDGRVDGYRIGEYPAEPYRGLERYRRPAGFVRLTRDLVDLRVSPRFTLGQFPTKRPRSWPKYLVLEERLLLKLEMLVERAAAEGVPTSGWRVLSGYRSPWYNRDIGRPKYSRHIYGDAADVYVDRDGDGRMDDLDGDGRATLRDADVLHRIVQRMDGERRMRHYLGGLGKYPTTSTHGPFVHVDTRGYRARW